MTHAPVSLIVLALGAMFFAGPAALAQGQPPSRDSQEALEDFARAAREALARLRGAVDPWVGPLSLYLSAPQDYLPPEVLPGGDIIIRRRVATPDQTGPGLDL